MLTVNLFDTAFVHNPGSSVHGKTAKRIQYVRSRLSWDGITLITDAMLSESGHLFQVLKSRIKVGWLLEPREYVPERYKRIPYIIDKLDLLLTHDQELLDAYPAKARFVPFGGCWIKESAWGLHPKSERVVQILSGKMFMQGHRLRHAIMRRFPEIDCHGWGTERGRFPNKEPILAPAAFCIVVENSRASNFFTEKLLDCFAVGTVPIYWGCPNIGDFFDMRGIIPFDSIEDLPEILTNLDYDRHLPGIEANLEEFRQYEITDDWISEHILETLGS